MKAYQLKIAVKNSKPPIWRRCIIPSGLTFSQLSLILNKVMGWSGYHLSEFEFYHLGLHIVEDAEELGIGDYYDYADASTTYIGEYMENNGWFTYTYDLGDCWDHRITIEKVIPDYPFNYPQVIKFKGACPIEDSGGIDGYYECLEIMADPSQPEHDERCSWAESQGYEREYDMQAVNGELEQECFLIWGKGETRSQRDIYEEFFDGTYGLRATKSDKNKTKPTRSRRHALDDVMNRFVERLSAYYGHNDNSNPRNLKAIFQNFEKDDLVDIAREKGIPNLNRYRKEQLSEVLSEKMLEPDEVERYFSCLSKTELDAFEQAVKGGCYYFEGDVFQKLYMASYLGVRENDHIVVPGDVYAVYLKIKSRKFEETRKKRSWQLACFDVAEALYGVVPAEVMVKLFNKGEGKILSEEELIQEAGEIPKCYQKFVYRNGRFYHNMLYPNDRNLVLSQGKKEFYIPSREEIADMKENGYFYRDKHIQAFIRYLTSQRGVNKELAELMGHEVQQKICGDGSMQEVMDILLIGGLKVSEEDDLEDLLTAVSELWNHTRMLLNRGFTPAELSEVRGVESKPPIFSVLDGGKNYGMHVMQKKVKKIYPNDPCSCRSGKKYKNCCGRN